MEVLDLRSIYMVTNQYLRQSGIINIEEFRDNEITIIGCGAIGSFVAPCLAKMGLTKFTLYDMDKIEYHNLPNQFFFTSDIGRNKVDITRAFMIAFNSECRDLRNVKCKKKYKGGKLKTPIVISCVDSMDIRRRIFDSCKKDDKVELFIDTRMGGLQGQVYLVDMSKRKEIRNYEKSLFKPEEAEQIRCTERSIIFTVLGIASIVCNQIVKSFRGEKISNYIVLDYNVPQMF